MSAPISHRGWVMHFDHPPIPIRSFDWCATHPDYDGEGDDRIVHGETQREVIEAIECWYLDQEEEA